MPRAIVVYLANDSRRHPAGLALALLGGLLISSSHGAGQSRAMT
jgi:hypothetical protein